eukprot:569073-Amphidinium_carterae.1
MVFSGSYAPRHRQQRACCREFWQSLCGTLIPMCSWWLSTCAREFLRVMLEIVSNSTHVRVECGSKPLRDYQLLFSQNGLISSKQALSMA